MLHKSNPPVTLTSVVSKHIWYKSSPHLVATSSSISRVFTLSMVADSGVGAGVAGRVQVVPADSLGTGAENIKIKGLL